jgi:hypothetical protein
LRRKLLTFKVVVPTIPVRVYEMKTAADLKVPATSGTIRIGVRQYLTAEVTEGVLDFALILYYKDGVIF